MLDLKLRAEFLQEDMRNTAIEFRRYDRTGALDISPNEFFEITYPSIDLQNALTAIDEKTEGRPIVLLGERGRGKSHIMAALHHAFESPFIVEQWAQGWLRQSAAESLRDLRLRKGYIPITVNLNDQEYPALWDVLFREHPLGERFYGRFLDRQQNVPSKPLIVEMLQNQPVALLLDELQTWYDGTSDDTEKSGPKHRSWAFSFLQILSEIAVEYPKILILIVSIRNTNTDAYDQLHRKHPRLIDFLAPMARRDRQQLILHRLFENRRFILTSMISDITTVYRQERFRLIRSYQDASSEERSNQEVIEAWPFSPELMDVLEDQILPSPQAQGLRDLIRILALIYRNDHADIPLFTPADFTIDNPKNDAVKSLLSAISGSGQSELYNTALSNLKAVQEGGITAPHLSGIMSALWMRSFSTANKRGATERQLHIDVTHECNMDDNLFADQLEQIVTHSFNIHFDNIGGERRYLFRREENPRSKLLASARNSMLFADAKDKNYIRQILKADLSPASISTTVQVIVLGPNWQTDPWSEVADFERPGRWETPVLLVLPKAPLDLDRDLGKWLKEFVPQKRNTVRFLIPKVSAKALYNDPEVYLNARASLLADDWKKEYQTAGRDFVKALREAFENRFDRYAVLRYWNFQQPTMCEFTVGQLNKKVTDITRTIDDKLKNDHFELEAFDVLVKILAGQLKNVGALLQELREPPASPQEEAIVYLGESAISEQLIHLVVERKLALKVRGEWLKRGDETEPEALARLRSKAFKQGRELADIAMGLPHMVGTHASSTTPPEIPMRPVETSSSLSINDSSPSQKQLEGVLPNLWSNAGTYSNSSPTSSFVFQPDSSSDVLESADYYTSQSAVEQPPTHNNPPKRRRSEPEPSLKLVSHLEKWGLAANQTVPVARLEFRTIKVAELKLVLQ